MRIAVALNSRMLGFEHSLDSHFQYLYDANAAVADFVIFVSYSSINDPQILRNWVIAMSKRRRGFRIVSSVDTIDISPKFVKSCVKTQQLSGDARFRKTLYLQHAHRRRVLDMIQKYECDSDAVFDWIVFTRSDLRYASFIDLSRVHAPVTIPGIGEDCNGIYDRFAIVRRDVAWIYANVVFELPRACRHPEKYGWPAHKTVNSEIVLLGTLMKYGVAKQMIERATWKMTLNRDGVCLDHYSYAARFAFVAKGTYVDEMRVPKITKAFQAIMKEGCRRQRAGCSWSRRVKRDPLIYHQLFTVETRAFGNNITAARLYKPHVAFVMIYGGRGQWGGNSSSADGDAEAIKQLGAPEIIVVAPMPEPITQQSDGKASHSMLVDAPELDAAVCGAHRVVEWLRRDPTPVLSARVVDVREALLDELGSSAGRKRAQRMMGNGSASPDGEARSSHFMATVVRIFSLAAAVAAASET
jgi:hypothetical protein